MKLKTTLALAFGAAALVSILIAQDTAEKIRVVNVAQKGNPPTGPNQVVIEQDQGLKTHTIYRPVNLTASKYPLLVWGEGGCAKNGLTFPEYLSEIASHGFVIVADGPPVENAGGAKGGPGGPGAGKGVPPDAAKGKGGPPAVAAAAKGK